jgi:restriction system protein
MPRSSGSSGSYGSYRDYEAAQRAAEQKEKKAEQERKKRLRQQEADEAVARDKEAATKTLAIERRVSELEALLRSSLARDPRISFESMRRTAAIPPLDLGSLTTPGPAPDWTDFVPNQPRGLRGLLGGGQRYQAAYEEAEHAFARAQEDHRRYEATRQRKVADARAAWERKAAEGKREAAAHNAHIDKLAASFRDQDRLAVSEYVQMVLDGSPYPGGFPTQRRAGYVPESSLLAVEWYLPTIDIVPEYKAFKHVKSHKAVEPVKRSADEIQKLYVRVIAQIAVRTVREVFVAAPDDMISTVVFTGHVDTVNPATGRRIRPPLITLRATKELFNELVPTEPRFDPVASIRKHFFAGISPHPAELVPVEPVMPFSMADPRVVEPIDVLSTIDTRPNLLELTPSEFESFVQNLFTKMGYETKQYQRSGDGGIDCMAYKRDSVAPMKIAVQAKLYNRTVAPTHVRDLYGTIQHEGATLGIMITTSGYGPDSWKFANGKPLHLIDGTGLLSICQEHRIPARILNLGKRLLGL